MIIEEIENGLHPLATVRLVEYLVSAAARKSIQVIFTTHSNDALGGLPHEAVWACVGSELQQGKLDVRALRAMEGHVGSRLAIYVEDDMAVDMVNAAMRKHMLEQMDLVEVHALGGVGNVLKVQRARRVDPATSNRTIALLDGDQRPGLSLGADESDIGFLPGTTNPEDHVFAVVLSDIDGFAAKLAYGMGHDVIRQSFVTQQVRSVDRTNRERHQVFIEVGAQCGLVSEARTRQAFLTCWAEARPDEAAEIANFIRDAIDLT